MTSYRDTSTDVKAQDLGHAAHNEQTPSPTGQSSSEKPSIEGLEHGSEQVFHDLTPEEQKRALRKCDYRVIPLLGLLYLVAFIDRSNM